MMRCAMKNQQLSIHRACLRLCVQETEEEEIESTGVEVCGGGVGGAECERQREDDREGSRVGGRGGGGGAGGRVQQ